MRRKQGALVPLERDILDAAERLDGEEFYGYRLSKQLGERNSTVYRALLRLEKMGLLKSQWASGRKTGARKRYYRLTGGTNSHAAVEEYTNDPEVRCPLGCDSYGSLE